MTTTWTFGGTAFTAGDIDDVLSPLYGTRLQQRLLDEYRIEVPPLHGPHTHSASYGYPPPCTMTSTTIEL